MQTIVDISLHIFPRIFFYHIFLCVCISKCSSVCLVCLAFFYTFLSVSRKNIFVYFVALCECCSCLCPNFMSVIIFLSLLSSVYICIPVICYPFFFLHRFTLSLYLYQMYYLFSLSFTLLLLFYISSIPLYTFFSIVSLTISAFI